MCRLDQENPDERGLQLLLQLLFQFLGLATDRPMSIPNEAET